MNFRDLGGVRAGNGLVAPGRLYRTGHLSEIDADAAAHLHGVLNIGVYIDFRAELETTRDGAPAPLIARGVRWQKHPFDISDADFERVRVPRPSDWQALYLRAILRLRPEISGAIRLIAEQATPLVFGCWAGKDRTGIVAALLLSLLGVADEAIAEDYAKTSQGLSGFRDRFSSLWQGAPDFEELTLAHTTTHPQAMLGLLEDLRARFGSVQSALDLSEQSLTDLKRRYLAP